MYKSIEDIDFGHSIESFDKTRDTLSTNLHQAQQVLEEIRKHQDVAAMTLFCSENLKCIHCLNKVEFCDELQVIFLNNISKQLYRSLNLTELLELGESIYNSLTQIDYTIYSKIEEMTRDQNKCEIWFDIRIGRVTASLFKKCCRTKIESPSLSLIKQITAPGTYNFRTKATDWGIENESRALQSLKEKVFCEHNEFSMVKCGFFIRSDLPHLGASPDALIYCSCHDFITVEVKCPFKFKNSDNLLNDMINETDCPLICVANSIEMNKKHSYYYQVQLQMFITGAKVGYFLCWAPKDQILVIVKKDEPFLFENLEKASDFFRKILLPELLGNYYTK